MRAPRAGTGSVKHGTCVNTNGHYFTVGHSHGFSPTAWNRLNAAMLIVRQRMPHLTIEDRRPA